MSALSEALQDALPAQRRAKILDIIRQHGAVSIQELSHETGVSAATIRRDLNYLSEYNYIERTHGGAVLSQLTAFEPGHDINAASARNEKEAIGHAAAMRLKRGQSVIFDFSSTVLEAAKVVAQHNIAIQAITNDIAIAHVLANAPHIKVIVPGGSVRPNSYALLGEPGLRFFETLNADVALLGIHGLADDMLSDTSIEAAASKRAVINAAQQRILLADASKAKAKAFCKVCHVNEVDEIITDTGASDAWCQHLQELDINVASVDSRKGVL